MNNFNKRLYNILIKETVIPDFSLDTIRNIRTQAGYTGIQTEPLITRGQQKVTTKRDNKKVTTKRGNKKVTRKVKSTNKN